MGIGRIAKRAGKWTMYAAFGFATPSILKSAELLGREARRTGEGVGTIKELAGQAAEGLRATFGSKARQDIGFDEMLAARGDQAPSMKAVYFHFLRRKRACLGSLVFFLLVAIVGGAQGRLMALVPLIVGGGLCLEFAWVTEFRLWQLRGRKLSAAEGASLADFARDNGAWRRMFSVEHGYGLDAPQRRYRATLWHKRAGLAAASLGTVVTIDMYFSTLIRLSAIPACVAACGMLYAMAAELRLRELREAIGKQDPVLGPIRLEIGACLEELRK